MPDLAIISSALSSIKAATDIAKLIKDSGTSLEQAEIKLKIADLIGSLADAKMEIATIQTDLITKDQEILELQNQLKLQKLVEWDKPYYWVIDGDTKDGPFCQQCYDKDKELIRLQGGGINYWHCQTCKSKVIDKNYVKPSTKQVGVFGGI